MSTLSDVAKMANVSIATVSNYLNHTHPVSAQKEARIKEAIENLHYVPNTTARTLKKKSANDIGVILPNLQDSYYNQIYEGIKSVFSNTSYNLRIQFSEDIQKKKKKNCREFYFSQCKRPDTHLLSARKLGILSKILFRTGLSYCCNRPDDKRSKL